MSSQVAQTIFQQLGGNRFVAMTGARDFVASADYLMFRLPHAANKANKVRVTLTPDDLYTVDFLKMGRADVKTISSHPMVYADNLVQLIERQTGLTTHL